MSLCLKQLQIVCKNLQFDQDVTIFKATVKNNKKSHVPMCTNFSTKEKGSTTVLQPSMCSIHFR